MTMRIDRYSKAVLTVIAALCVFNLGGTGVQALTTVLTDQQLLALAHVMLSRGLLNEDDLARRMKAVRSRLETS